MKRIVYIFSVIIIVLSTVLVPVYAQMGSKSTEYDERIKELLLDREIQYTIDTDGDYKIEFDMGNGRTQVAFIFSKTYEYGNFEIREIHSYAYKAQNGDFPKEVAIKMLEDSYQKKLGAWTKSGDYAIFITRIAADTDSESLWNALLLTLESADEMEAILTGDTDEF